MSLTRCTYPAMTPRWPLMYGPTIRGGTTFLIGVPGSIRAACAGSRPEPTELLPPASAATSGSRMPVSWSGGLHVAAGQETPISGMGAQPILPWRLTIPTVKYGFHRFHYIELAPGARTAPPGRVGGRVAGCQ